MKLFAQRRMQKKISQAVRLGQVSRLSWAVIFLGFLGVAVGVTFQNCGSGFKPKGFADQPLSGAEDNANSSDPSQPSQKYQTAACMFNGLVITAGSTVTAYQKSSVPSGQSCLSETRACSGGVLSGSFSNPSCLVVSPGNCALGASEIMNGATVTGYSTPHVATGQLCSSVSAAAVCTNGVLTANIFPTCTVAPPTSCPFNGEYIPNDTAVTAFLAPNVPNGALCSSQLRTCNNGVLSGSFSSPKCTPAPSAYCYFGDTKVGNGESVQVYSTNLVPYGQACTTAQESITCNNGVFIFADGTLANNNYSATCLPAATTTCMYGSTTLQSGQTASGYATSTVPVGQTCNAITINCNGGVFTGLPNPKKGIPFATGKISPLPSTCSVGGCEYNGNIIANQQTVAAYSKSLVGHSESCTSVETTFTCTDGTLRDPKGVAVGSTNSTPGAGSGFSPTCSSAPTTTCSFTNWVNGGLSQVTVQSGQTLTGYSSKAVLEGKTCASVQENVSCNDGVISLNGNSNNQNFGVFYFYDSCDVGACTFAGQTILDGTTINAYSASFVAYGQSCTSVQSTLTCKNSFMLTPNGNANVYGYSTSCAPVTSANCSLTNWINYSTINLLDGQTITGYSTASVKAGDTCANHQETLSCSSGLASLNGASPIPPSSIGFFHYSTTCN